jgi:hypothetical protein
MILTWTLSIVKGICRFDISDLGISLVYMILLGWCIRLISDHRASWTSGQANGLIWYLVCTTLLCTFRAVAFAMVPFAGAGCNQHYKSWQWELDGSGNTTQLYDFTLIVLSTASAGLFFSSYSYFAHSLAKVLDMLTLDHASATTANSRFLILLLGLNISVWLGILSLWFASLFNLSYSDLIDNFAQYSVSLAALTTCTVFSFHFLRAYSFLRR